MKSILYVLALTLSLMFSGFAFAHCEIPCGIYDDQLRINQIREHIITIEKSIKNINKLSAADEKNYNQLVRWINNKEKHANELQEIVYQYFMNQRIKPADVSDKIIYQRYIDQISLAHQLLVFAMKAKQSTDLANVEKLHSLVDDFEKAYFNKPGMKKAKEAGNE